MRFQVGASLLVLSAAVSAEPCEKRQNATVNSTAQATKMVVMDNDWSSAGFIPVLLALDAGWEVLGLTSGA